MKRPTNRVSVKSAWSLGRTAKIGQGAAGRQGHCAGGADQHEVRAGQQRPYGRAHHQGVQAEDGVDAGQDSRGHRIGDVGDTRC